MSDRIQRIEASLRQAFAPSELEIIDESHQHAGHAGAKTGLGHFALIVVAQAFAGQNPLERHRLIYAALGELMKTDIHALRIIRAQAPDE